MAIACSYCGREVPPGSSVCPACGQNVSAAAAPPFAPVGSVNPGTPPPPGYPQQSMPYTAAPPAPNSGGGAVKIILIVVGVFVALGVLAMAIVGFGAWRVSKALRADSKTGAFTYNTPNGTISAGGMGAVSEADLGVALYPGATRTEGSMNMKSPTGSVIIASYISTDPASQVVEFYKTKLGENASTIDTGSSSMITSPDDNKKNKVMVTVTPDDGKTKFTITHTTKK